MQNVKPLAIRLRVGKQCLILSVVKEAESSPPAHLSPIDEGLTNLHYPAKSAPT